MNHPSPSHDAAHPILEPVRQVVEAARHVRVEATEIERAARWLAGEELPWPAFRSSLIPGEDNAETMDFVFLTAAVNFAFTDFATGRVFRVFHEGLWRSDSDAMMACLKKAHDRGVPILDGRWLSRLQRNDLEEIFRGSTTMPMLDRRLEILRGIGETLDANWGGRFHHFAAAGPPRLYAGSDGLLARLVREFPSFEDVSPWRGLQVPFMKRAQLLFWLLHCLLRADGFFAVQDLEQMTIFADYIVPMALSLLGILVYDRALEEAIQARRVIPADSPQEVEIRAASIWACRLLTEAVNRRRPADRQILDPVLDARLWTHYHASHLPHHLTVTTDY